MNLALVKDWATIPINDLIYLRKERIDPQKNGGSYICIELDNIAQGTGRLTGFTDVFDTLSLKSMFKKDDVLFGKLRAYLRKYWLADCDGVCSTEMWVLVANRDKIIPKFLYQLVQTEQFIKIASSTYGTHMPRSDWNVVKNFKIQLPSVIEQEAIAEVLSDMDAYIKALEQLIAKKRLIKQGVMQELLTGKRRLPGFSGEWERKKIGEILTLNYGKSQREITTLHGEFPVIGTGGVVSRSGSYIFDRPSIIIGRKGSIDFPQYFDSPFWAIDTTFYSDVKDIANSKFIYYLFLRIDWRSYNEASGVPSLSAQTINNIEVNLPPEPEQRAIANVLTDMDSELKNVETKRNKIKLIKQGMMQELLTGRIRLVSPA